MTVIMFNLLDTRRTFKRDKSITKTLTRPYAEYVRVNKRGNSYLKSAGK